MWLVGERKRCIMQKSKTSFNNMMMVTFREAIMFGYTRRCGKVRNTTMSKEMKECEKFSPIITVNLYNQTVKKIQ